MLNSKIIILKYYTIFFWIIISFTLLLYQVYSPKSSNEDIERSIFLLGWFGILVFVLGVISWKLINRTLLTPFILWWSSLFAFCYGHFILNAINFHSVILVTDMYSRHDVIKAQYFTLYALIAFIIGALTSIKSQINFKSLPYNIEKFDVAARKIGWLMFLVGFVPTIIKHYENIKISLLYGYSGLFKVKEVKTGFSNIFSVLDPFFISGLFILLYVYRNNKQKYYVFFAIVILYIILELTSGNRDLGLPMLVSLVIIDIVTQKKGTLKIDWKKISLYSVLGILVISAFPAFKNTRNMEGKSIGAFIESYKTTFKDENPLLLAFAEMGHSLRPLIETMRVLPYIQDFSWGETYLWGLTAVFPNLFWDQHPASIHSNIAGWVKEVMNISYGPGSSLPTEAFYNFGWYGILCLIPLGFFIAKLSNLTNLDIKEAKPFKLLLVCIFIVFSLTLARRGLFDVVRPITYYGFLPLLLIYFTMDRNKKVAKNWSIKYGNKYKKI